MIRLYENFRALFYTPFYATEATGAYAAEGVEVSLETNPAPGDTSLRLLRGEVDVVWGGPLRVMTHHNTDVECPLVLFCEAIPRDPFCLVGARPEPDFELARLAEVRLAVVSEVPTPWLCLQEDLRRAGVDLSRVQPLTGRTMPENAAALRAGEVDVIQVFEPYVSELIRAGAGHLWYAQASRGLTAYTSFYTRRDVLATQADELLRMTRALARTLRWVHAQPAAEVARTVAPYFPAVAAEVLRDAIARYQASGVFGHDPLLRPEGFDWLKSALLNAGFIQRDTPYAECVDTALAEQVLAEQR